MRVPRAWHLNGTRNSRHHTGRISYRHDEALPKPCIGCMAVMHSGLLVKNTNKGGNTAPNIIGLLIY